MGCAMDTPASVTGQKMGESEAFVKTFLSFFFFFEDVLWKGTFVCGRPVKFFCESHWTVITA